MIHNITLQVALPDLDLSSSTPKTVLQQPQQQQNNKTEELLKEEEQLKLMLKQQEEIDQLKAQLSNNVLHIPDPLQMAQSLKNTVSHTIQHLLCFALHFSIILTNNVTIITSS